MAYQVSVMVPSLFVCSIIYDGLYCLVYTRIPDTSDIVCHAIAYHVIAYNVIDDLWWFGWLILYWGYAS